MSFDWTTYLDLAKSLSKANDEASLQSAVSRSYYSVFNLVSSRAKANGYRPKYDELGGSHELLWALCQRNEDNESCKRLAILGPRMKKRRLKADYHDSVARLSEETQNAIEDAEECVKLLSALPKDYPKDIPRKYSF
jgi:uncharacterized protein (UPF0332 family)